MARVSYISRIRSRAVELEASIKEMERELQELRIAERVLGRMGSEDDEDDASQPKAAKPKTVSELIAEVLTVYGALESREILDRVLERQETTFNTVSTTLSRMKDQGLVALDGKNWRLAFDGGLNDKAEPSANQTGSNPQPE